MTFNLQGSLRAKYLDGKKTINIDSDITDISGSLSANDASFSNIDIGHFSINPTINYDFTSSNNTFVDNIYTFKDGRTAQAKYINNTLEEITWNHNEGITLSKNSCLETDGFYIENEFTIEMVFKLNDDNAIPYSIQGNKFYKDQGLLYFGKRPPARAFGNGPPPDLYFSIRKSSADDGTFNIYFNQLGEFGFGLQHSVQWHGPQPSYYTNIHMILSIKQVRDIDHASPYQVRTWLDGVKQGDQQQHFNRNNGGTYGLNAGVRDIHIIGWGGTFSSAVFNHEPNEPSAPTIQYIKYYDFPINDTQAKNMYKRYKEPRLIVNGDISCNGFLRGDGSKLSNIDTLPDKKEGLFLSKTHTGVEWIADVSLNNVDVSNNVNIGGSQTISNVFNINSGIIQLYNTNNQIINSNPNYESIILDSLNKYYMFWNFKGKNVGWVPEFIGQGQGYQTWEQSVANSASPFRHANLNGYTILGHAPSSPSWWQKEVNIEENDKIIYNSNTGHFIVPIDGIYQIRLNCVFDIYSKSGDSMTEHDIFGIYSDTIAAHTAANVPLHDAFLPPAPPPAWEHTGDGASAGTIEAIIGRTNDYPNSTVLQTIAEPALINPERAHNHLGHNSRCDLPISIRIKPIGIGNLWSETYDGWWDVGWDRYRIPHANHWTTPFGGPGAGVGRPSTIEEAFSQAEEFTRKNAGTAFTLFQLKLPTSVSNNNIYLYYYRGVGPHSALVDWKSKFRVDKFPGDNTGPGTGNTIQIQPGIIKSHVRTSYPFSYKTVGDNIEITLVEDSSYPFISYINNATGARPGTGVVQYWNYAIINLMAMWIPSKVSRPSMLDYDITLKAQAYVCHSPPIASFRYIYIERIAYNQYIEIAFIQVLANVDGVVTNITQDLPDGVNTTDDALLVSKFHYTNDVPDRANKGAHIFDHTEYDWPNYVDAANARFVDNQRILVSNIAVEGKRWASVDLGKLYKVSDIYHVVISAQTKFDSNRNRFNNVKFSLSEHPLSHQGVASFTNENNSSIVFKGDRYDPDRLPTLDSGSGGPAYITISSTHPNRSDDPSPSSNFPSLSTAGSGWSDDGITFKWVIPRSYFNADNGFNPTVQSDESVHYILTLSLAHIDQNQIPDWSKLTNNGHPSDGFINTYTTPFVINTDSSWTAEQNPRGDTTPKKYTSIGQISVIEKGPGSTGGNYSNVSTSITRELKRYDQILYTIDKIDDINSDNNDKESECWFTEETSGSIHRICP